MLEKINNILTGFENKNIDLEKTKSDANIIMEAMKAKRLAIYPAGVNGQLIQKTLLENDIKIEFFVDRAFENLKEINGAKVFDTSKLKELGDDFFIIISANLQTQFEFFNNIVKELNPNANIIYGEYLNRLLKIPNCINKLNKNETFDLIECENCGFERKQCPVASKYLYRIGNHKEVENDFRSKRFDWVGYIVSQTCTLKCKHCCEMVPHLSDKGFSPVETIVKDVKKIAQSSKFLNFVELIGGEPFLHPEYKRLISELLKIENIGYIKSFTNATVIPSDELCEIMKNPRFMLSVSNYEKVATGKLLENIMITREKLDKFGIKYLFTTNFEWLDFSSFDNQKKSLEVLKQGFKDCFISICHRIYKGKLYRCPHQYAGIQLGKLQEKPIECIDIHSLNENELAQALEKFEDLEFINACQHCKLPYNAEPATAGEQLESMNVK